MTGLGIGFFFIFLLNFGISWLNAWGVGRTWVESKAAGGWTHFVTWCAAIMSGCGFTWCYLFVLGFLAGSMTYHGHPLLAPKYVQGMLELGYAVIILPIVGSGLGITISSWRDFARRRDLLSGGVAAYNTFAEIYDIVNMVEVMPGIFKNLDGLFNDGDKDSDELMIFLVVLALVSGFATTFAIVKHTASVHSMQVQMQLAASRQAKSQSAAS